MGGLGGGQDLLYLCTAGVPLRPFRASDPVYTPGAGYGGVGGWGLGGHRALDMALVCPPPHMLHLWPWRALKAGGRSAKPDFEAGERAGDKVCVGGGDGRRIALAGEGVFHKV